MLPTSKNFLEADKKSSPKPENTPKAKAFSKKSSLKYDSKTNSNTKRKSSSPLSYHHNSISPDCSKQNYNFANFDEKFTMTPSPISAKFGNNGRTNKKDATSTSTHASSKMQEPTGQTSAFDYHSQLRHHKTNTTAQNTPMQNFHKENEDKIKFHNSEYIPEVDKGITVRNENTKSSKKYVMHETKSSTYQQRNYVDNSITNQTDENENDDAPLLRRDIVPSASIATCVKASSSTAFGAWDSFMAYLFLFFSVLSRCVYISRGNYVVWDEAHFGKFASHYIKRTFYTDVHPPLGKSLLGLVGWVSGYNGTFAFESGHAYPLDVKYGVMRLFCAFFGALIVPLAYLSCRNLNLSRSASFTSAFFLLCENALTVISRFILLDSLLLFCTALGFYYWSLFYKLETSSSARGKFSWWVALFATGVSLGLVSSVKWVGLFLIAFVGLHTLENLWDSFGDLRMSVTRYSYHWIARIICLIIVPILVYMLCFKIHLSVLTNSGPGDSQMSSLFQANLNNSALKNLPLEIAFGSRVTLRSNGWGGGILHSHVQTFPHGSKQQQVTCYHHRDSNNEWIISKPRNSEGLVLPLNLEPEFIKNGDLIRLVHKSTGRCLHSHPVAAPISKRYNEVSGYGNLTVGDANDNWIVEIASDVFRSKSEIQKPNSRIHALLTKIRLRHQYTGCLLRSDQRNLPEWGFKQHEVVCDKGKDSYSRNNSINNIWNVEEHWNQALPFAVPSTFTTSFPDDFININAGMWVTNNALVSDPEKEPDNLVSEPLDWPLLLKPLRMCSWDDKNIKFMMMGNPLVWWISAASLACYVFLYCCYKTLWQRHLMRPFSPETWNKFTTVGRYFLTAWILHYAPFMLMGRVLYLHHYFPALYFAVLHVGFMLDHTLGYAPKLIKIGIYLALNVAVAVSFGIFAPLTYGYEGPATDLVPRAQWLSEWKIA